MAIFEIREYVDGGPSDRGRVIGYKKTDKTRQELREEQGHSFIDYHEITPEEYLEKRKKVEEELAMFNIEL